MSTTAFGDFLRFYRLRALLTQEDLCERTGVSVRAISDMERGRALSPQRRTVELLVAGLELADDEAAEFIDRARARRRGSTSEAKYQETAALVEEDPAASTPVPPLPGSVSALPPMLTELTGREPEQQTLDELVREAESSSLLQVAVIHGSPGAGKTALAVDAGHRLADRFANGCLFVDLRGLGEDPLSPDRTAHRLLRGLGVDERQIPSHPDDKLALYQSLLRERSVLLVLDNAANEAQVRPLLVTSPGTLVLITSRSTLAGLDARHRLALHLLRLDRAVALLRAVVGEQRVAAEPDATGRLAALCGGVPLALLIAGNRLASRPQWTIAHLADQLEDERRRLSILTAGDLQVRAAFQHSYEHLSPAAAEMFRKLALIPGHHTGVALAAVAAGQPELLAEEALEELADASLLGIGEAPGRYTRHDLLRVFARERLEREEDPEVLRELTTRMRHWLLAVATKAAQLFDHDNPQAGVRIDGPDPVHDRDSADRWLTAELEHWRGALRSAVELGEHERVLEVARAMHWYSDLRGVGELWREVFRAGANAAREIGDAAETAAQLNYLSWANYALDGLLQEALAAHEAATVAAAESGDTRTEAWTAYYGAGIQRRLGNGQEAVRLGRRAVTLFAQAGYAIGENLALNLLGLILHGVGELDEAVAVQRRSVAQHRTAHPRPGNEELLSMMLVRLATTIAATGAVEDALDLFDEAESLFRKNGAAMGVARVQHERGTALMNARRFGEAREQLLLALVAARSVDERVECLVLLAEIADESGDHALAREHRVRALAECAGFDTPAMRRMTAKLASALGVPVSA